MRPRNVVISISQCVRCCAMFVLWNVAFSSQVSTGIADQLDYNNGRD